MSPLLAMTRESLSQALRIAARSGDAWLAADATAALRKLTKRARRVRPARKGRPS